MFFWGSILNSYNRKFLYVNISSGGECVRAVLKDSHFGIGSDIDSSFRHSAAPNIRSNHQLDVCQPTVHNLASQDRSL